MGAADTADDMIKAATTLTTVRITEYQRLPIPHMVKVLSPDYEPVSEVATMLHTSRPYFSEAAQLSPEVAAQPLGS